MKLAQRCIACDGAHLSYSPAILTPFIASRIFHWRPVRVTADWGLRDIENGMAYSICNSAMCDDCGMLFLDMRFDDEEMAALYRDYRSEAYTASRESFEPGYATRNALLLDGAGYIALVEAFLRPHLPRKPRVLDWGGDTGVNTPFRSTAARHDVYDISNRPLVAGAHAVSLETAKAAPYDLIVYSNVLEHVSYPREALREIAGAMRPQTLLYVEVPHEAVVREFHDKRRRLEQKRHWHEHINFFSSDALDALFRNAGLLVIERKSKIITAGGKESCVFFIALKLNL